MSVQAKIALYLKAVPRPMKMGTIASPWRYEDMRWNARAQPRVRQYPGSLRLLASLEAPCGLCDFASPDHLPSRLWQRVTLERALQVEKSNGGASRKRMKMMRQRRRIWGMRELRLVVADACSHGGATTGRQAGRWPSEPDREHDALIWIRSVSEFDADATRHLVTVAAGW